MCLIQWLNQNAGAVTAFATLVLAGLTAWYVILTREIAIASRDTVRLATEAQEAERRQSVRSLTPLVRRLSEMAAALPVPLGVLTVQGLPLWTDDDLSDLEALARMVEGADLQAASVAVKHLRFIAERIEEIKRDEAGSGWNANKLLPPVWAQHVTDARNALAALLK